LESNSSSVLEMRDRQAIRQAYGQAQESWLLAPLPAAGVVHVAGPDRLDFLSRLSTQNLEQQAPGTWRVTLLLSPIGRLVDRLTVLAEPERLLLLTSPGRAEAARQWLVGYLFFQDEVAVASEPADRRQWALLGPQSDGLVASWDPALARLPPGNLAQLDTGYLWRLQVPAGGWQLLGAGPWESHMPHRQAQAAAWAAWQALRIEAGLPDPVQELQENLTPLELGLRPAIAFDKGCYIGQEVIARMDSRGQAPRHLWQLRLDGPAEAGAHLQQGEKTVGRVTSAAWSPDNGWVALGLIERRAGGNGQPTGLSLADGTTVTAVRTAGEPDPG